MGDDSPNRARIACLHRLPTPRRASAQPTNHPQPSSAAESSALPQVAYVLLRKPMTTCSGMLLQGASPSSGCVRSSGGDHEHHQCRARQRLRRRAGRISGGSDAFSIHGDSIRVTMAGLPLPRAQLGCRDDHLAPRRVPHSPGHRCAPPGSSLHPPHRAVAPGPHPRARPAALTTTPFQPREEPVGPKRTLPFRDHADSSEQQAATLPNPRGRHEVHALAATRLATFRPPDMCEMLGGFEMGRCW